MICTGNYRNCENGKLVSIQGDRGKKVGFIGDAYPLLAPKRSFWNIWFENIGKIDEQENNQYYIEQYYEQVLKHLDPQKVLEDLNGKILLCSEEPDQFCHRHIVAFWLEVTLGIIVPEVKLDKCGRYTVLERPQWIREMLLKVMMKEKCKTITLNK